MIYKAVKIFRKALMKWPTETLYFPLIARIYPSWGIRLQRETLAKLPAGSLGNCLLNFIVKNNFPFSKGTELHDTKHVLLVYETEFEDEIAMQYFELGNGNRSLPVWMVIIGGTLLSPEFIPVYIKAFKRGWIAKPLTTEFLIGNINTNLIQLKNDLRV